MTLEKELESIRKQNAWLETELEAKISEFQNFRSLKTSEITDLKASLLAAQTLTDELSKTCESQKAALEVTSESLESFMRKECDLRKDLYSKEESFKIELEQKERIIQLMKDDIRDRESMQENSEKIIAELEENIKKLEEELVSKDKIVGLLF